MPSEIENGLENLPNSLINKEINAVIEPVIYQSGKHDWQGRTTDKEHLSLCNELIIELATNRIKILLRMAFCYLKLISELKAEDKLGNSHN